MSFKKQDMVQPTQVMDTTPRLLLLPPEIRHMIFSFAVAEQEILLTAYNEPALLKVSRQVRSEARKAWYQEAELTIMVGSNFIDRAQLKKKPGSSFDLDHVTKLRDTVGLVDIDYSTNSFLEAIPARTIFSHVKLKIYNEAHLERTRHIAHTPSHSRRLDDVMARRIRRERESLMLASLTLSYTHRQLRLHIQRGESHPEVYKPKPTMRPPGPAPYDVCDVYAALEAAIGRFEQVAGEESFKGFTFEDVVKIASAFRFLTPRGRFQDAVLEVMDMQAKSGGNGSV